MYLDTSTQIEFFCFFVFIVFKPVSYKFSQFVRYFFKKFDHCLPIVVISQFETSSTAALLFWGIHKISNFVEFAMHNLLIFSANSCKQVLLLPCLVMTKVAKLSHVISEILMRILLLIILSKFMTPSGLWFVGFYGRYVTLSHSKNCSKMTVLGKS